MSQASIQALLFDLGGVLIEIDFDRIFQQWVHLSSLSFAEIKQRFQYDAAFKQFERGDISSAHYFDYLRKTLLLQATDEQIALGWNAIFIGEISETLQLVQKTQHHIPCYAFSNTNVLHQAEMQRRYPHVLAAFNQVFYSHEIGLRKPERVAFEYIAQSIAVPVGSILFFDDLAENVKGAIEIGLQATLVKSPQDVTHALIVIHD